MPKYIDADAFINKIRRYTPSIYDSLMRQKGFSLEEIEGAVYAEPAADVAEVRHGRWILGDRFTYDGHGEMVRHPGGITCSQCRYTFAEKYLWSRSYCPHCGTKMAREEDDA